MNNPFIALVIFIIILFFYIHITAQWKTSDDLEIYESDYESPAHLQEVCSIKQPVVFKHLSKMSTQDKTQSIEPFFERFQAANFEKYDNLDIRVKDVKDYLAGTPGVDFVPISLRSARRLLKTDTKSQYFSENNHDFLEESGLDRVSAALDPVLKPPLSIYKKYDILLGSPLVATPLRYHLESHRFLAVTRGKIRVKLCPPKYGRILPQIADYENYEFVSPVNPWLSANANIKDKDKTHENILQKIKFLEAEVHSGDILFLPPYWWYSISFSGDAETTVASLVYDIAPNVLAQSKHWALYYLQQSNIKNRPVKTIVLSESPVATEPEEEEPSKQNDANSSSDQKNTEIVTNAGIYIVNSN